MTDNQQKQLVKTELLGVGITNASEVEILEYLFESLRDSRKKVEIFTPNPEILIYAHTHPNFKKILNTAQISLADGVGISWASKLLAKPLKQRITGVDLMKMICHESAKKPITVGFLGQDRE